MDDDEGPSLLLCDDGDERSDDVAYADVETLMIMVFCM